MSTSTQTSSGGISFFGLLTIVFIALKLTDVIDWSWFWVLSPIIIPAIIVMAIFSLILLSSLKS